MLTVISSYEIIHLSPYSLKIFGPFFWIFWPIFKLRNSDSEYGLSLLTDGRLNDGITPSSCKVDSMVAPFIGLTLSECKYT
jgi:hypothetical protein